MTLYTKSYWKKVVETISELIPKDIVLSYLLPIIYINLERLRFETLSFLIPCKGRVFAPSYYMHSLDLLGHILVNGEWLSKLDKIISNTNYEHLIKIQNFPYPIHISYYFYWKSKGFPSNCNIKRTGSISKEVFNNNTSKLLWGYEEKKNFHLYDNVIILLPGKEKGYLTVKGYISFDDKKFEGNRRYIGLSEEKNKVEVFDTHLYKNGEFKVFGKNIFDDKACVKVNNINCVYQGKECNKILPWNILPDDIFIITSGPINKRNIETYRFVKTLIKNNFLKIIVINKNCEEKIINLQLFEKPVLYKCNTKIISSKSGRFIKVDYHCFQTNLKKFDTYLKYFIIFKNDKLIPLVIPKLITSTILGGLGSELIINDEKITIMIPSFEHEFKMYTEFLRNVSKQIKKILPENTNVEVNNISHYELLIKIT